MADGGEAELYRLAADLQAAGPKALAEARAIAQKAALNIKRDARAFSSGIAHAPAYPFSITYDTDFFAGGVRAEIGPDKGKRQGALGNILEFGTSKNAPVRHLGPALDREAPAFVRFMGEIAGDVL